MRSAPLFRSFPPKIALPLALTLLACVPGKQSTTSATTTLNTNDTTNDGATTTDATGGASTSTSDGTTASSTTSMDTLDTTAETTGFICAPGPVEGGVECEPPGASIGYYQILTYPPMGACTILSIADDGVELQTLTLQCGASDPFDLEIHTATPHVPVPVTEGASVTIDHGYWNDECPGTGVVALRDEDDELLFGGISAPTEALSPTPLDWSPLQISLEASDCPSTLADCGILGALVKNRSALKISLADAAALVFPGNSAVIGEEDPYTINVSSADSLVCYTDRCVYTCSNVRVSAVWVRGLAG